MRKKKQPLNFDMQYQSLEPRQLMAVSTSIAMINNVETLLIDGTAGDDYVEVSKNEYGELFVNEKVSEFVEIGYAIEGSASVERIKFVGRNGNDTFVNQTAVNSSAAGNKGNDVLIGGNGHNWFQGGKGNDRLIGGEKNDQLRGRDGHDVLYGGKRHDKIYGGAGNDLITAGSGNDEVFGNLGRDTIYGGNGDDVVAGGHGADHILLGNGRGADTVVYDEAFTDLTISAVEEYIFVLEPNGFQDTVQDADFLRVEGEDFLAEDYFLRLNDVERESLNLVQELRAERGLRQLTLTQDMSEYARDRAQHVLAGLGPNPTSSELFGAHSNASDIEFLANNARTLYLENLAYLGDTNLSPVEAAIRIHDSLESSQLHLANMTHREASEFGIGIVRTNDGWFVLHNFFVN